MATAWRATFLPFATCDGGNGIYSPALHDELHYADGALILAIHALRDGEKEEPPNGLCTLAWRAPTSGSAGSLATEQTHPTRCATGYMCSTRDAPPHLKLCGAGNAGKTPAGLRIYCPRTFAALLVFQGYHGLGSRIVFSVGPRSSGRTPLARQPGKKKVLPNTPINGTLNKHSIV